MKSIMIVVGDLLGKECLTDHSFLLWSCFLADPAFRFHVDLTGRPSVAPSLYFLVLTLYGASERHSQDAGGHVELRRRSPAFSAVFSPVFNVKARPQIHPTDRPVRSVRLNLTRGSDMLYTKGDIWVPSPSPPPRGCVMPFRQSRVMPLLV